jgi:hypothetical protein
MVYNNSACSTDDNSNACNNAYDNMAYNSSDADNTGDSNIYDSIGSIFAEPDLAVYLVNYLE